MSPYLSIAHPFPASPSDKEQQLGQGATRIWGPNWAQVRLHERRMRMWNMNWECTQPKILIKTFYTRTASQPINHSISRVTTRRQFPVEAKLCRRWICGDDGGVSGAGRIRSLGCSLEMSRIPHHPPHGCFRHRRRWGGDRARQGDGCGRAAGWARRWVSGKSFIPIIKVQNFIGQLSNHLSVLFGLFRRN